MSPRTPIFGTLAGSMFRLALVTAFVLAFLLAGGLETGGWSW